MADYLTTAVLPEDLKRDLPTVAELEAELDSGELDDPVD